jgi:hypothetical protein
MIIICLIICECCWGGCGGAGGEHHAPRQRYVHPREGCHTSALWWGYDPGTLLRKRNKLCDIPKKDVTLVHFDGDMIQVHSCENPENFPESSWWRGLKGNFYEKFREYALWVRALNCQSKFSAFSWIFRRSAVCRPHSGNLKRKGNCFAMFMYVQTKKFTHFSFISYGWSWHYDHVSLWRWQ